MRRTGGLEEVCSSARPSLTSLRACLGPTGDTPGPHSESLSSGPQSSATHTPPACPSVILSERPGRTVSGDQKQVSQLHPPQPLLGSAACELQGPGSATQSVPCEEATSSLLPGTLGAAAALPAASCPRHPHTWSAQFCHCCCVVGSIWKSSRALF